MHFLEKIFSVKNSKDKTHKVMTILGLKIKFKRKLKNNIELNTFDNKKADEILLSLKQVKNKTIMKDNIWQINKTKFYLPYYPVDFIQKYIIDEGKFFEQDELNSIINYIPNNAVIFDIGSNIGNHCLYWCMGCNKKIDKIFAFEPIKDTFDILKKNIELNNLEDIVQVYNFGLSDKASYTEILTYRKSNIGDTHLKPSTVIDKNNVIELKCLDEFLDESEINIEKIDFMKIDVEDMEIYCLKGARNTIQKYKPVIFIESYPDIFPDVLNFMEEIGYEKREELPHHNYIFQKS